MAYPARVSRLVLVTPGLAAAGVEGTEEQVSAGLARRASEPWYPSAAAALDKIFAGDRSMEAFLASRPFYYGRWDDAAQAHATAGVSAGHQAAREGFFAGLTLEVPRSGRPGEAHRAGSAVRGELDPMVTPALVTEAARLFQDATVVV